MKVSESSVENVELHRQRMAHGSQQHRYKANDQISPSYDFFR
jgi:hypothetical protein